MSKKITAKEFARIKGHNDKRTSFIINKLYAKDEVNTVKQWETKLVADKVIDPIEKIDKKESETED